jgi:hypothetical protein
MSIVGRFQTGEYEVTRHGKGTYIRGRYEEGETTVLRISASKQPATGRDIQQLSEGERIGQHWKLYTDVQLQISTQKGLATADRVLIDGESFKVMSCEPMLGLGAISYFKSIVWREPQT